MREPSHVDELSTRTGLEPAVVVRLLDVLLVLALVRCDGDRYAAVEDLIAVSAPGSAAAEALRADLRTTSLQTADLASRGRRGELTVGWSHTDPDLLQAQGTMSAGAVDLLEHVLFPSLDGIQERLAAPGGAFLDVGAGVAAISIAMARRHPHLRVVALEPQEAPLALARENVAAAELGDRVELRQAAVQNLDEEQAYDIAWVPLNFLPTAVAEVGVAQVHRALRDGGWALLATLGSERLDLRPSPACAPCCGAATRCRPRRSRRCSPRRGSPRSACNRPRAPASPRSSRGARSSAAPVRSCP